MVPSLKRKAHKHTPNGKGSTHTCRSFWGPFLMSGWGILGQSLVLEPPSDLEARLGEVDADGDVAINLHLVRGAYATSVEHVLKRLKLHIV